MYGSVLNPLHSVPSFSPKMIFPHPLTPNLLIVLLPWAVGVLFRRMRRIPEDKYSQMLNTNHVEFNT
jgi:hypothetical protein